MSAHEALDWREMPATQAKPRQAVVRTLDVVETNGDPTDPTVEALIIQRRLIVSVVDFYLKGMP